jgi:nitroreductase
MEAITALKTRRSYRAYRDRPIDRAVLEEIVDCARLSATAMNIQPWEFVVLTGRETLEAVSNKMNHSQFVGKAAAAILVFCKQGDYSLEDGCAASENILVAAAALELGACWIAGDKQEFAEPLRELVGAPETLKLVSIISLGYPAETPEPAERRPLSEVLHWEKYGK